MIAHYGEPGDTRASNARGLFAGGASNIITHRLPVRIVIGAARVLRIFIYVQLVAAWGKSVLTGCPSCRDGLLGVCWWWAELGRKRSRPFYVPALRVSRPLAGDGGDARLLVSCAAADQMMLIAFPTVRLCASQV